VKNVLDHSKKCIQQKVHCITEKSALYLSEVHSTKSALDVNEKCTGSQ